jgi:hypothetical protein
MTKENQDEITFLGLQKFLCRIGFEQFAEEDKSLAFHHRETGTMILVSVPQDRRTVRPADLLSVSTRLEFQGLIDEVALNQFKSGKLPRAA